MKQNIQDKAAFFAQYWGQSVIVSETNGHANKRYKVESSEMHDHFFLHECYLELTPLSEITDEDAIEVAKILHGRDCVPEICYNDGEQITLSPYGRSAYGWNEININTKGFLSYDRADSLKVIQAYDLLRRNGYLIPYAGHTTDQLLEMGWAKLKTK